MKIKTIFIVCLFFLVQFASVRAQVTILKGRVIEQNSGDPVPFATVLVLYDTASDSRLISGVVTEEDGSFSLEISDSCNYLRIRFAGYKIKTITLDASTHDAKGKVIEMGDIPIVYDATSLQEVEVVATRNRYTMEDDKIVMNVDDNVSTTSANVFEMLRKVPGVVIDNDENLTLNGKGGVLFQFNGRDIRMPYESMKAILKSMPASSVSKIETIINPSAKYEAEGTGGILNIVLAQEQTTGFSGTFSSWNGISKNFRSFDNASLQFVNNRWTLSANGGIGVYNGFVETESKQYLWYNSDTTRIHQLPIENHNQFRSSNINLSADYKIDSNRSAGALFSFNAYKSPKIDNPLTIYHISTYPYSVVDSSYSNLTNSSNKGKNLMGGLYYNQRFDTAGSQLSLSFDFNSNISNGSSQSATNYFTHILDSLKRSENTHDSTLNEYNSFAFKADVLHRLTPRISLEYGLKSRLAIVDNDFIAFANNVFDSSRSNHLNYKENVNAVYLSLSHRLSTQLSYRAGLRMEHTYTSIVQKSTDEEKTNNYVNLFPNVNLSYRIGNTCNLTLNYSYRITRPDYNSLNPFETKLSDYSFKSGNPDLLPEYSHRVDLNLSLFYRIFITASYGYNNDEINYISVPKPGLIAVVQKPYNIGYQQYANLSVSGMMPFGPVEWTFWLQGGYQQAIAESSLLTMDLERFSFTTWQSLGINLPWELKWTVSGFYFSGMIQQGAEMGDMMMFNSSLTRTFLKKALKVSAGVNNIPASKAEVNAAYNNFRMESYMLWDKPYFNLNISYSFGKTANNNSIKRIQGDDMDSRKGNSEGQGQPNTIGAGGMSK